MEKTYFIKNGENYVMIQLDEQYLKQAFEEMLNNEPREEEIDPQSYLAGFVACGRQIIEFMEKYS